METLAIHIDIGPGVSLDLLKNPGWERRLRDRTIAEGRRLREEADRPYQMRQPKAVIGQSKQREIGDLYDWEEDT